MKSQLLLEYKGKTAPFQIILTFITVTMVLTYILGLENYGFNGGMFFYIALQMLDIEDKPLRYVLPLSKIQRFTYLIFTGLIKVLIFVVLYLIYLAIMRAPLEEYIRIIYAGSLIFIGITIINTMIKGIHKKSLIYTYYIVLIILAFAFGMTISNYNLWPMEIYVYSLAFALALLLIVLPIHYYFFDRLGHDVRPLITKTY